MGTARSLVSGGAGSALVALVAAASLAGCAGADEDALGASAAPVTALVQGDYRVPVPEELASVASNPVSVSVLAARGDVRLVYDLPAVIAGDGARVDLELDGTNDDGSLRFRGDEGRASCVVEGAELVCAIEYRDSVVSLDSARLAIERGGFSEREKPLRLDVARRFSVDPLGILRFAAPAYMLHCLPR